jgi:hypothetical protein
MECIIMDTLAVPETSVFQERRAHPRYKVDYIAEVCMGTEILFATVVDVSGGGLGIAFPGKFKIGEMLNIRINYRIHRSLSGPPDQVGICLKCQVSWQQKSGTLYRAGLQIVSIETRDRARLQEHLQQLSET